MMEPERVTAPTTKTKKPKKVAAGKAAYATRKEKEAKMLEDLQNAKKSLHDEIAKKPAGQEATLAKPQRKAQQSLPNNAHNQSPKDYYFVNSKQASN